MVFLIQSFGLVANILNHRATRVLFDGNSVEVSLANSIISMCMVVIICGAIELFSLTKEEIATDSISFQGPYWITMSLVLHPIMFINGFAELGYTCGTAAIYKSSVGVMLKVLAAFVAALCTKIILPLFGLKESSVSSPVYLLVVALAIPGVYLSLTKRKFCASLTFPAYRKVDDSEEDEMNVELSKLLPQPSTTSLSSLDSLESNSDVADATSELSELLPQPSTTSMSSLDSLESNSYVADATSQNVKQGAFVSSITDSFVISFGFVLLVVANTFWSLFQVLFASRFKINSTGYVSLDQIYGSLFTIGLTSLGTCLPFSRRWFNDRPASELIYAVVHKTFGSICTSPAAFTYLAGAKLLSNGMIVAYFLLSTHYDAGLVVLSMALTKVVIGVFYTLCTALCCPGFVALSQSEIAEITSYRYLFTRALGLLLILSALSFL